MNLTNILIGRAKSLPEGDYTIGINAVIQHIEVASKHLLRGQESADETAFTDAIYRTNQAFEGSLKEAYRVIAGKDPSHETPNHIESYLQKKNLLRPRVLAQFTNYRREWRNPATHDYRLDFDEDEALLAIVTVSAFAIVLIDQIVEYVAFERAKAAAAVAPEAAANEQPLAEKISRLIGQFVPLFNLAIVDLEDVRETAITGALAGFLTSNLPELDTKIESKLASDREERADLLLATKQERLLIEIKRSGLTNPFILQSALKQVSHYMELSGISQAVIFGFSFPNDGSIRLSERSATGGKGKIVVVTTTTRKT